MSDTQTHNVHAVRIRNNRIPLERCEKICTEPRDSAKRRTREHAEEAVRNAGTEIKLDLVRSLTLSVEE